MDTVLLTAYFNVLYKTRQTWRKCELLRLGITAA